MVFYEIDQKVQRFLSIDEEGIMSTMSLHPSGKSLAVAIKFQLKEEEVLSEEKAAYIVVYDLSSTKKKKVYSIREPLISVKFKLYWFALQEYVSLAFTKDNKNLVALSAAPDS